MKTQSFAKQCKLKCHGGIMIEEGLYFCNLELYPVIIRGKLHAIFSMRKTFCVIHQKCLIFSPTLSAGVSHAMVTPPPSPDKKANILFFSSHRVVMSATWWGYRKLAMTKVWLIGNACCLNLNQAIEKSCTYSNVLLTNWTSRPTFSDIFLKGSSYMYTIIGKCCDMHTIFLKSLKRA